MLDDMMNNAMQNYGITPFPEETPVAMAYVPFQVDNETVNVEQGLNSGTMFPVLDKPFIGCGGMKNE